jgi:hypothetical protein
MAAQDNRRQHAREVVREIVRSHGGLDEELWAQLNPELRTKFEEAFKKKDEMSGSTIIT